MMLVRIRGNYDSDIWDEAGTDRMVIALIYQRAYSKILENALLFQAHGDADGVFASKLVKWCEEQSFCHEEANQGVCEGEMASRMHLTSARIYVDVSRWIGQLFGIPSPIDKSLSNA